MELRFGITMRVTNAVGYDEPRDTIAHDWSKYMDSAFPKAKYLFIPNIGEKVIDFINDWNLNAIIISGGDDLGAKPLRDLTESTILNFAEISNIPVIAVCRGLQLVHHNFGGKLLPGNDFFVAKHRATKHKIEIEGISRMVNSYHNYRIDEQSINKDFMVLARCTEDNSIEAIEYKNILAMMWHPERDAEVSDWNKILIEKFIQKTDLV